MINETLIRSMEKNKMISIYTDLDDTERFSVGFLRGISENHVLIGAISSEGLYDGFYTQKLSRIYRVEDQTQYLDRIQKLYSIENQHHPEINAKEISSIYDLLYYALSNKLIVSIELLDSEINDSRGFVKTIDDYDILVDQIDYYGESDGLTVINLDDISEVTCDSVREQALKILYDHR